MGLDWCSLPDVGKTDRSCNLHMGSTQPGVWSLLDSLVPDHTLLETGTARSRISRKRPTHALRRTIETVSSRRTSSFLSSASLVRPGASVAGSMYPIDRGDGCYCRQTSNSGLAVSSAMSGHWRERGRRIEIRAPHVHEPDSYETVVEGCSTESGDGPPVV